jgi:hypothetical protein
MPFLTEFTIPADQANAVPTGLTWSSTPGTFVNINVAGILTLAGIGFAWGLYKGMKRARR